MIQSLFFHWFTSIEDTNGMLILSSIVLLIFPTSVFRIINPSKTVIGKISKTIFDKINIQLVSSIKVNQWKNSDSVINWFKNIPEKKLCTFIVFDIENREVLYHQRTWELIIN